MARCLETLVLARAGTLAAPFSSIEEWLGRNTREYYDVLAEVGAGSWHPERSARPWIRFCLKAHFQQASRLLQRTRDLERLWDAAEIELKRAGLPDRAVLAVVDAALGSRVRNATYRTVADVSDQVASRDLKMLVDAGLLVAHGERRGRFYKASERIQLLRRQTKETRTAHDPFDEDMGQLALPTVG
jgi:Fic family protein